MMHAMEDSYSMRFSFRRIRRDFLLRLLSLYSNKTFHLWWEMYASRSVIEGTNLDANLRQAVNHFEFNNTLVSKKVGY